MEQIVAPTWADLDKDTIDAFQIVIVTDFDDDIVATTKTWRRNEIDDDHWARLVEIAETAKCDDYPTGFSWVAYIWPTTTSDADPIMLSVPEYLYDYAETKGIWSRLKTQ